MAYAKKTKAKKAPFKTCSKCSSPARCKRGKTCLGKKK